MFAHLSYEEGLSVWLFIFVPELPMKLKIGEVAKCRFVIIIVKSFVFAKVILSIANQECYL